VPRSIVEGRVEGDRVHFQTRTLETDGIVERSLVHRYEGRVDGDRLLLTMQTVRDGVADVPLHFVARRGADGAPPPR
jgi:hypothetical protein